MCLHTPLPPLSTVPLDAVLAVLNFLHIADLNSLIEADVQPFHKDVIIAEANRRVREQIKDITANVEDFKHVLIASQSLISGGRALAIVDPRFYHLYHESLFQIYCPMNGHMAIVRFLLGQGYVEMFFGPSRDSPSRVRCRVTLYDPDRERYIEVIESEDLSAISPLTRFHCTPVSLSAFAGH